MNNNQKIQANQQPWRQIYLNFLFRDGRGISLHDRCSALTFVYSAYRPKIYSDVPSAVNERIRHSWVEFLMMTNEKTFYERAVNMADYRRLVCQLLPGNPMSDSVKTSIMLSGHLVRKPIILQDVTNRFFAYIREEYRIATNRFKTENNEYSNVFPPKTPCGIPVHWCENKPGKEQIISLPLYTERHLPQPGECFQLKSDDANLQWKIFFLKSFWGFDTIKQAVDHVISFTTPKTFDESIRIERNLGQQEFLKNISFKNNWILGYEKKNF